MKPTFQQEAHREVHMNEKVVKAWQPGMEITSESQYYELTEQLARSLLSENTPKELAVIAAQHLIYVDVLRQNKDEPTRGFVSKRNRPIKTTQAELESFLSGITKELASALSKGISKHAKSAGDARLKASSKEANDVRHEANRSRNEKAMSQWDAWEERNPKGKKVASTFAKKYCSKYGVTPTTMSRWITVHENKKATSIN